MEDVLGKTDFDTYPPELAAKFWADDKSVLDSGIPIISREEPGRDGQGNHNMGIDHQSAIARWEWADHGSCGYWTGYY